MCQLTESEIVRMALRDFIGKKINYYYSEPDVYNEAKKAQRDGYELIRWSPLLPERNSDASSNIVRERLTNASSNIVRERPTSASSNFVRERPTSASSNFVRERPTRADFASRASSSNIVAGASGSRSRSPLPSTSGGRGKAGGRHQPKSSTASKDLKEHLQGKKRPASSSATRQPGASGGKRRSLTPPLMDTRAKLKAELKPRKGIHPQATRHLEHRLTGPSQDDFVTSKNPMEKRRSCLKCGLQGHFRRSCRAVIKNCDYCTQYQALFPDYAQNKTGPGEEHSIVACVRLSYGCDWCKTRGHFDE
jgi:hypothetical protein